MEKEWKKTVGKRMPYSLPEGFFEANEAELMRRIATEQPHVVGRADGTPKGRLVPLSAWIGGAVAAMLVVGALFYLPQERPAEVEQALLYADHATLSEEELASWVEFYEADLFVSYE